MEKKNTDTLFLKGAMVLSLASFVTKILSALYKVPFQNLTGDQGFYVYQQIYPFYGIAQTLAISGIPLFVSKVISEDKDEEAHASQTKPRAEDLFFWIALISLCIFAILQIFAGPITKLMGDRQLAPALRSVSYMYLVLPIPAFLRGVFQGRLKMLPTAISQVSEQVVRVIILLGVAYVFSAHQGDVYRMGAWAVASTWLAGIIASLVLGIFSTREKIGLKRQLIPQQLTVETGKRLVLEGTSLVLTSSLLVILQFIDSFTVYRGLVLGGASRAEAMTLKGVYDRGLPFVQVGMVLGISLVTSLLPVLRSYYLDDKTKKWEELAGSVFRLTTLISLSCSIGLVLVMPWLNQVMFTDMAQTPILQISMVSILPASLIFCAQSVLQSTDKKNKSFLIVSLGLLIKLGLNSLFVRLLGTMGSALLTVLTLCLIFVMMVTCLPKGLFKAYNRSNFILKVGLSTLLMVGGLAGFLWLTGFFLNPMNLSRLASLFYLFVLCVIGALIYLSAVVNMEALSDKELAQIPKANLFKKLKWKRS